MAHEQSAEALLCITTQQPETATCFVLRWTSSQGPCTVSARASSASSQLTCAWRHFQPSLEARNKERDRTETNCGSGLLDGSSRNEPSGSKIWALVFCTDPLSTSGFLWHPRVWQRPLGFLWESHLGCGDASSVAVTLRAVATSLGRLKREREMGPMHTHSHTRSP